MTSSILLSILCKVFYIERPFNRAHEKGRGIGETDFIKLSN